jgi:hypothetical protein
MKQKSKSSKSLHLEDKSKKPSKWKSFLNIFSHKQKKKEINLPDNPDNTANITQNVTLYNNPNNQIENIPVSKPEKEKINANLPSAFLYSQRKTLNDSNETLCNILKKTMKTPDKKFMSDVLFTNSNFDENSVRRIKKKQSKKYFSFKKNVRK